MNPSSNWFTMCQPGQQLTGDDVRPIDVDADDTLHAIPADRLSTIVGQYAKVRLVAGSLVVTESLQGAPLVSSGAAVVAIQVRDGSLPIGLHERSPVELVVPVAGDGSTPAPPTIVSGRVVGLPTAASHGDRHAVVVGGSARATGGDGGRQRRRSGGARSAGSRRGRRRRAGDTETEGHVSLVAIVGDDATTTTLALGRGIEAGNDDVLVVEADPSAAGHSPRGSTSRSPRRCRQS